MIMKKITDERLQLQNLKNIRIIYILQTLGIIGILGYDFVTKGLEGMRGNPLWLVFMLTAVIHALLSMKISVASENTKFIAKKSLYISILVVLSIAILLGTLVTLTPGYTIVDGLIIGSVIFGCFLIPASYMFYLRKKMQDEV